MRNWGFLFLFLFLFFFFWGGRGWWLGSWFVLDLFCIFIVMVIDIIFIFF